MQSCCVQGPTGSTYAARVSDPFSRKLDVRIAFLVQFDVVVKYASDASGRPDAFSFTPLPLLLFSGPFAFPRQGQLLISLLPHQLLGRQQIIFGQPFIDAVAKQR